MEVGDNPQGNEDQKTVEKKRAELKKKKQKEAI